MSGDSCWSSRSIASPPPPPPPPAGGRGPRPVDPRRPGAQESPLSSSLPLRGRQNHGHSICPPEPAVVSAPPHSRQQRDIPSGPPRGPPFSGGIGARRPSG